MNTDMNNKDIILSPEECKLVLKRYFNNEDFKLIDYNIVTLSDGVEGFLGEHYIIKTKIERNSDVFPVSFFAKIPPLKYDLQLEYTRASYSFEKEIFFYEELVKDFQIYCPTFDASIVPKFYFSRGNDIIVMENLQQKKFCVAHFTDRLDVKHIKFILKVLTKLHSASIIYEEKKSIELGKPFRLIDKYAEFFEEAFFRSDKNYLGYKWHKASQKGILAIIDLMPDMEISKDEFKEKFYHLTEESMNTVKPSTRFRNVLSHGDLWLKNALFRYENGIPADCKLVDFQLMKYNPPAFDVLKIIYQTTSSEMRKHHFEDFLKYYYDNLCKELTLGDIDASKVLSRDEFQASIKYMLPQCKVETSYYYSFQKFGPEFLKDLMNNCEGFRNFTFGDRTPFMLEHYKEGSVYKMYMDEIMLDIKDMLANQRFTREDCYAILRRKLNTTEFDLLKYSVNNLNEKSGFLGDHVKIVMNIKYNNENIDLKFFAKSLPDTIFNNFIITSGAFNNEKFMFDQVFYKMSLFGINEIYNSVPKCFYTRRNDILVFEDLNELGFETVNKFKSYGFDEICVVIKTLAQIHASVLILEEKLSKRNGQQFRVENQYNNDLMEIAYVKTEGHLGLEAIRSAMKGVHAEIDLYPDPESSITNDQFKQLVTDLYENTLFDLAGPSKKYRNVLCHGDLWAANIMIKYESDKPVDSRIVDFQAVKICPPAQDLMCLLYLTTTRKFRANFMSDIIQLYHNELGNFVKEHNFDIEDIIPLQEFLESCDVYKVFAINQASTHFPLIMMQSKHIENFVNDKELCYDTMFVDRSDFIRDMCGKDKQYRTLLEESIKDLRALCENIYEHCNSH